LKRIKIFVLQIVQGIRHISIKSQSILFLFIVHNFATFSMSIGNFVLSLSFSLSLSSQIYFNLRCKLKRIVRIDFHSPTNVKRQLISFFFMCAGASIAVRVTIVHKRWPLSRQFHWLLQFLLLLSRMCIRYR